MGVFIYCIHLMADVFVEVVCDIGYGELAGGFGIWNIVNSSVATYYRNEKELVICK